MRVFVVNKKTLVRAGMILCAALIVLAGVKIILGDPSQEASMDAASASAEQRKIPVYSVETKEKRIALTFDAAWGAEKTSEIMDILDQHNIKATFFLVGFWVDKYPEKVKEIHERGFEIGNHSSTHPKLSTLSSEQILMEANTCADKIEELTGARPVLFRPPFGDYNNTVVQTLRENGYEVIQWSTDSLDWKNLGVQSMVKQVTGNVKAGDIVLFHNNSDYILQALPIILQYLEDNNFEIVPVSQLLLTGDSYVDNAGVMRAR